MEWYQKSAEQGNAVAQCNLGWCYEQGRGVKTDYSQAKEWYKKSAAQNNQRGYYLLADIVYIEQVFLRRKSTIKKFLETAEGKEMLRNYETAAGLGHEDAKKKLEKLKKYMK